MDKNYRMTVSRDRLAEFRRNSAILSASNNQNQQLQSPQRTRMDRHSVADCYNINKNTTQYQPQVYSHYSYKTQIDNERYPSLHSFNQPTSLIESRSKDLSTTEAFFFKIEEIKQLVSKINENVTEIESLHSSSLSSINGEHSTQVSYILENLSRQTSELNKRAKDCIKETEISNAKLPLNPSDRHMRQTQLQATKKKFIETIQKYQDIELIYENQQRQRIERQILIVKPEATPHEIEMAIDSDDAPQIFAHSLLNLSRTGNASQVLNEMQTRHRDIKKIERTILELHQLFLDMQQMIEFQEETIIKIEKSSETANYDLELGNKDVVVAVTKAKSTRKRKWYCFIIFLLLLVIAGILIWWFVFPKSRSSSHIESTETSSV